MITNGNKMIIDEPTTSSSSETNDQTIIQQQREYIKLLESELQSLKEHFQSSMEKIMTSPFFSQSILLSVVVPSITTTPTPTTTSTNNIPPISQSNLSNNNKSSTKKAKTQPNNNTKQQASTTTTPIKKRKFQQEEEESSSDSEEDEEDEEEDESTEEESSTRKTRQQSRKSDVIYDSDEEPVIENIFDMKFWNREIAKWKKINTKTLPKVKTPKEGTKQPLEELEKILEKQVETTPTKSKSKSKKAKETAQSTPTTVTNNTNGSSSSSSNGESNSNVIDISTCDKEPYLFDSDDKEPVALTEPIIKAIGTKIATKVEVFKKLWEYLYEKQLFNENHRISMDPLIKSVLGIESNDVITINEFNRHVVEQLREATINKQKKEDISQKFTIL
ncbi:predicted protein [Naegleria gruberi]|uniref:Predicted protein n=1 Tax=Naegleria gruberi TaxID=5762 RepID=D2VPH8_NAEGR|nr:uncharacterized protein NAEGRDRAFT_70865 [Naegleria gruberi]EFC41210.1 predicted protein [Naegleria gruberi]|eukprot:XP_002673954.1 predicted protein [Naegleria gruberi strain NEG-M]